MKARVQPQLSREGDVLWDVEELAAFTKFTTKGIYNMTSGRKIPFVRIGNRVRFWKNDILDWLSKNQVPALEK